VPALVLGIAPQFPLRAAHEEAGRVHQDRKERDGPQPAAPPQNHLGAAGPGAHHAGVLLFGRRREAHRDGPFLSGAERELPLPRGEAEGAAVLFDRPAQGAAAGVAEDEVEVEAGARRRPPEVERVGEQRAERRAGRGRDVVAHQRPVPRLVPCAQREVPLDAARNGPDARGLLLSRRHRDRGRADRRAGHPVRLRERAVQPADLVRRGRAGLAVVPGRRPGEGDHRVVHGGDAEVGHAGGGERVARARPLGAAAGGGRDQKKNGGGGGAGRRPGRGERAGGRHG